MKTIGTFQIYLEVFKNQIELATKNQVQNKDEHYSEVCKAYAQIVATLSKNERTKNMEVRDLLPLTNIFLDYQETYFNSM